MEADSTKTGGSGSTRRLVSIVVPALNEEESLPRVEGELLSVVDPLPYDFEFIIIDTASTDRTGEIAKEMCRRDPRWRHIGFGRNSAAETSITAGYRHASGDVTIVLYSDLQDPPDVIPRLLAKWEEGYDAVLGVQTSRKGDPLWRNTMVQDALEHGSASHWQ
jgi:polyisoprenyl-phosphate glycosyltransferase